ncbi:MAG: DUF2782 domain-containing protein [bacterium]|nr:DUF2782 domain-containing protein [Gammaproteobacteria bacterium]
MIRVIIFLVGVLSVLPASASEIYIPSREEIAEGDVEIVAGEDQIVYEYRVGGRLMMIKVVPKVGISYYMVPADGSAHYKGLELKQKLYPQFVIIEW